MLSLAHSAAALRRNARSFGRRTGARAHLPKLRLNKKKAKPAPPPQNPRPRRREALPPPDAQEDPAAALARLEALFDVDDDDDVAEAPRGPASLQEKLAVLARPPSAPSHDAAADRRDAYAAARRLWRSANTDAQTPGAWAALALVAARARAADDAVAIVDAMAAAHPGAFEAASDDAANALTAVVRGYSLEKRSAAAWASFDAAVAAGYYDPSPPAEAFDAVLHCCAHQQLPERALNVVDDMRRNGVPRTGATYAALMKAVATAPQWHRAYRLITDDVLDAMEGDRVAPTPALYVHLIGACGRVGDAAAAGCYFDEMRDAHGFSRGPAAYAAYFGALANAMTVGTKRGVKARAPHVDPWRGLGISDEEATSVQAADPAAFDAADDLGAGFHRKRDEPAGAVVTVAEEAEEDDDDRAGVEATLAALEGDVDDATLAALRAASVDDDEEEELSREDLDAFLAGLADEDLSDDDKELLAASLGGSEADLDALLAPEDELTEADLLALLEGPGDATAAEAAEATAPAMAASSSSETAVAFSPKPPTPAVARDRGLVTRLREMDLEDLSVKVTAPELHARRERIIADAEEVFAAMDAEPDAAALNAYLSIFTRGERRARARRVAAELGETYGDRFPDARSERVVMAMLAARGDLGACREALDNASPAARGDVELLGSALDAFARKGEMEEAYGLAVELAAAHAARGARGVGASDARPVVPAVLREAFDLVDFAPARKRRGPPERFLRNFRRLCRQRRVDQPPELPPDPVLWRQEGSTFRRSRRGQRDVPQKRTLLRAGRR